MKDRKKAAPVFKPYEQDQLLLIPPSADELIPADHLARVIDSTIDGMALEALLVTYEGGGASSYSPVMLLKVLIYAYTQKVYSSRRIAKQVRENVVYMWLAGGNKPDFRTINNFRSSHLKDCIQDVFGETVGILVEEGFIALKSYYLDGTKIEANANKYSFVWRKATEKYKARLEAQIREILAEADRAMAAENEEYGDRDLEELGGNGPIPPEKLKAAIDRINEKLKARMAEHAGLKKKLRTLEAKDLPRLHKYERQLEIMEDRKSCSKTDPDATFMGMKEDPMRNHQLKAAYNVQMGTEDQFIVGFTIHQKPGDTTCMIPHLKALKKTVGALPTTIVADAGYGSEENYAFLERRRIRAFVKDSMFRKEKERAFAKQAYRKENLPYDAERDRFTCPAGRHLTFRHEQHKTSENGFRSTLRVYEGHRCGSCEHRRACCAGDGNRRIQVNRNLDRLRTKARKRLDSPEGLRHRSQRPVDVESVWGQIKQNRGFRRFLLRGLPKVQAEWGLVALAHNMIKKQGALV
ncbi:MAG TPA: IS1182 family transposase [Spirochaetales bacterium]|nr:IS1182 family transposase [Spirochaetales bacterium]